MIVTFIEKKYILFYPNKLFEKGAYPGMRDFDCDHLVEALGAQLNDPDRALQGLGVL